MVLARLKKHSRPTIAIGLKQVQRCFFYKMPVDTTIQNLSHSTAQINKSVTGSLKRENGAHPYKWNNDFKGSGHCA